MANQRKANQPGQAPLQLRGCLPTKFWRHSTKIERRRFPIGFIFSLLELDHYAHTCVPTVHIKLTDLLTMLFELSFISEAIIN